MFDLFTVVQNGYDLDKEVVYEQVDHLLGMDFDHPAYRAFQQFCKRSSVNSLLVDPVHQRKQFRPHVLQLRLVPLRCHEVSLSLHGLVVDPYQVPRLLMQKIGRGGEVGLACGVDADYLGEFLKVRGLDAAVDWSAFLALGLLSLPLLENALYKILLVGNVFSVGDFPQRGFGSEGSISLFVELFHPGQFLCKGIVFKLVSRELSLIVLEELDGVGVGSRARIMPRSCSISPLASFKLRSRGLGVDSASGGLELAMRSTVA